jgi:hypothetical protein
MPSPCRPVRPRARPVPMVGRDPRWGRGAETYSEDPMLSRSLLVPFITALQGSDPKYLKVSATPKHYTACTSGWRSSAHPHWSLWWASFVHHAGWSASGCERVHAAV